MIAVECEPDVILVRVLGVPSKKIYHAGSKGRVVKAVEKFGGFKLTLFSLLGYGLLIPYLGIISSPIPFILGYVIPIWPFFWTGQMAYTYELSEEGYEAENLGTLTTITSCSSFLALLGGTLTNAVGLNAGITLAGFLYFISVSVLLLPVIYKK